MLVSKCLARDMDAVYCIVLRTWTKNAEGEGESGELEEAGRVRCVDRMSEVCRKYDKPIIGSGSGFKRPHTRGSLAHSPHLYCLRGGGAAFTRVTVLGNVVKAQGEISITYWPKLIST